VNAWVDPEGYRKWVDAQRQKFEAAVAKESAPGVSAAAQKAVAAR
jgi:hypothetical protein